MNGKKRVMRRESLPAKDKGLCSREFTVSISWVTETSYWSSCLKMRGLGKPVRVARAPTAGFIKVPFQKNFPKKLKKAGNKLNIVKQVLQQKAGGMMVDSYDSISRGKAFLCPFQGSSFSDNYLDYAPESSI